MPTLASPSWVAWLEYPGRRRRFREALKAKGVDSTLQIIDGAGHGWAPGTRQAQEAETATLAFLRRHLRR